MKLNDSLRAKFSKVESLGAQGNKGKLALANPKLLFEALQAIQTFRQKYGTSKDFSLNLWEVQMAIQPGQETLVLPCLSQSFFSLPYQPTIAGFHSTFHFPSRPFRTLEVVDTTSGEEIATGVSLNNYAIQASGSCLAFSVIVCIYLLVHYPLCN